METFKNCQEVKHIMIIIIDYDFLSYVIFDQQLKITFRNPQPPPPPEKIHSPLKIQKVQVLHFLLTLKMFQAPPAERGGEDTDKNC